MDAGIDVVPTSTPGGEDAPSPTLVDAGMAASSRLRRRSRRSRDAVARGSEDRRHGREANGSEAPRGNGAGMPAAMATATRTGT